LAAALTETAVEMAAQAIMTTDTFPKGAAATVQGEGGVIHISGIAKGSGMIAPDMATMLVYIFTDAKRSACHALQKMVSRGVGCRHSTRSPWTATPRPPTRCLSPPPAQSLRRRRQGQGGQGLRGRPSRRHA
jgi:hypothetical protein